MLKQVTETQDIQGATRDTELVKFCCKFFQFQFRGNNRKYVFIIDELI